MKYTLQFLAQTLGPALFIFALGNAIGYWFECGKDLCLWSGNVKITIAVCTIASWFILCIAFINFDDKT